MSRNSSRPEGEKQVEQRLYFPSPFEKLTSPFLSSTPAASGSSPNLPPWLSSALEDPATVAVLAASSAAALTLLGVKGYRRYFRRLRNADSVTGQILQKTPWVTGIVTRHVPTSAKDLKDETLSIRIAGVDAPELAHFGNPAQPHAKESLQWLTKTVEGKRLKVHMLRKDQYGRIVGIPYIPRFILPNKALPLMMLKEGMAVVYTAGGAEFGPWGVDAMRKVEDEARRARRGLWSARKLELPGEFKKRMKGDGEGANTINLGKQRSWWERLGMWLGGKT